MDYLEAIERLKGLNLSKYPEAQIRDLIKQFGASGLIQFNFHPEKINYRARPNENGESFNHRSQLSYTSAELNKKYQRASIPYNSVFYGGIIPENLNPN
ncbi:MAG: hypothetical protein U0V49_02175 [Saprospiraceae bacterium]